MSVVINGSAGVTTNSGAVYDGIQRGTAVASTSGTSINFTGIPSWVKRITVMFSGVSTNGTSVYLLQIGDSGGIENTGYLSTTTGIASGVFPAVQTFTSGFGINADFDSATAVFHGSITLALLNSSTFTWASSGVLSSTTVLRVSPSAGSKSLSDTLTQIRITTVNGTDTFDAGSINILYE